MSTDFNAASVAIVARDKVLLVERARPPYKGYWTFPGGRIEPGESANACARREIREELALDLGPLIPIGTVAGGGNFQLAVFAAAWIESVPVPCDEIVAFRWVRPAETANLRMTPGLQHLMFKAIEAVAEDADGLRDGPASGKSAS